MQKLHRFYANLAELISMTECYILNIGSYRRPDGALDPPIKSVENKCSYYFFSMEAVKSQQERTKHEIYYCNYSAGQINRCP